MIKYISILVVILQVLDAFGINGLTILKIHKIILKP